MYHPMLTYAVAQTRVDDINREVVRRARRREAASSVPVTDAAPRTGITERLARFAARRTRPSAA